MRKLTISKTTVKPNYSGSVSIKLKSEGDEVAFSFTVLYDPNVLTIKEMVSADLPEGWVFNHTPNNMHDGSLELLFDGTTPIAKAGETVTLGFIKFKAKKPVNSQYSDLTFADKPTPRSTSNIQGALLQTAYVDGRVNVK